MAVTVDVTPDSPTATEDFCKFDIAGLTLNDPTTYDATPTPPDLSMDEVRYYLTFELASEEKGRSPVFACNADGEWQFNNYVFPEAGEWTVHVRLAADDSSAGNQAVTVA
jgi:hypothetical protein